MAEQVIFIVSEDSETRRDAAERLRAALGVHVMPLAGGEPAIAWARALRPALVVLTAMPVMNGCDLARRLRQHPDTCQIPVVAADPRLPESDVRRWQDAGCTAVLREPLLGPALSYAIRAGLGQLIASPPHAAA